VSASTAATAAWVRAVTGARNVEVIGRAPAVTSDLLQVSADGRMLGLRHPKPQYVDEQPTIATDEAVALRGARAVLGNVVPEVVAFDDGGAVGRPALLMSWLPGVPVIHGVDIARLVATLVHLHDATPPAALPSYRPWLDFATLDVPEWTRDRDAWATLVTLARHARPDAPHVFLHRDYHPGNVLWADGEISGIVDWPYACAGPRAVDIAHCRVNLALIDGVAAADAFLDAYRARVPSYAHDSYWDAVDILSFSSDFVGVMAFNAFGAEFTVDELRARADKFARAVADSA
jgi:aminoglycoside phosphotransferase (APT) family kinase protein